MHKNEEVALMFSDNYGARLNAYTGIYDTIYSELRLFYFFPHSLEYPLVVKYKCRLHETAYFLYFMACLNYVSSLNFLQNSHLG